MKLFSKEGSTVSKNTVEFLNEIAKHASNRSEMKDVEYKVLIMPAPPEDLFYVSVVNPYVKCFRDQHSRKQADQDIIDYHVLKYHLPHLIDHIDDNRNIFMKDVVPGMYQYQRSISGKRRRWTRVESLFD